MNKSPPTAFRVLSAVALAKADPRSAFVCSLLLTFSLAGFAADNDVIRVGRVELYPTWSSVGIELSYSGDDARQADARFVWRRAGESARPTGSK